MTIDLKPGLDIEKLDEFINQDLMTKQMEEKMNLVNQISKETMTVVFNDNSADIGTANSKGKYEQIPVCRD